MSLVDKLEGVHLGDLILLYKGESSRVGYIVEYSTRKITLSNASTVENGIVINRPGFLDRVFFIDTRWNEKYVTYRLDDFDAYEVLRKCSPDKDVLSNEVTSKGRG